METKKDLTCTTCGGNATVAVTKYRDLIKKGERLCMKCYKALTKSFYQRQFNK